MKYVKGLSVCMIVKNEEKNIGVCIESLLGVANEFVIVDTGSIDLTKTIIESYRDRVEIQLVDFKWCDDFAAARNFGLPLARYEWVLQFDADERISRRDHDILRKAISLKEWDSYRMIKRSYVNDPGLGWFIPRSSDDVYSESQGWLGWTAEPNDLLFRNHEKLRYRSCIHETITQSLADLKYRACWLNEVPIHHFGRFDMSSKEDKYLELVKKRCREEDDAEAYNTLGAHYDWKKRSVEAVEAFLESLKRKPDYERPLYGLVISYYKLQKRKELYETASKLVSMSPTNYDLAWAYLVDEEFRRGNLREAIDWAQKAVDANSSFFHVRYALSCVLSAAAKNELSQVLRILPQHSLAQKKFVYLDLCSSLI